MSRGVHIGAGRAAQGKLRHEGPQSVTQTKGVEEYFRQREQHVQGTRSQACQWNCSDSVLSEQRGAGGHAEMRAEEYMGATNLHFPQTQPWATLRWAEGDIRKALPSRISQSRAKSSSRLPPGSHLRCLLPPSSPT